MSLSSRFTNHNPLNTTFWGWTFRVKHATWRVIVQIFIFVVVVAVLKRSCRSEWTVEGFQRRWNRSQPCDRGHGGDVAKEKKECVWLRNVEGEGGTLFEVLRGCGVREMTLVWWGNYESAIVWCVAGVSFALLTFVVIGGVKIDSLDGWKWF